MNLQNEQQGLKSRWLRWLIYLLVISASSVAAGYRILHVNLLDQATRERLKSEGKPYWEGSPLLSANDRSRWCTIRALGDGNRYEIDGIIANPDNPGEFDLADPRKRNRFWATIDLVKHPDQQGEMHYYSSKPTLLPTLLAYLYRGVRLVTGKDLENHPFEVVRILLILVNVVPMALFLVLMAAVFETLAQDSYTRIILLVGASLGTYLTPFSITLNNHLPAAFSVGVVLFALVHILKNRNAWSIHFFVAGVFSAFAAANELPALSFFCWVGLILLVKNFFRTLLFFVPGAALVIAGFFVTNYNAHHDWIPPYAHRDDGEVVGRLDDGLYQAVEKKEVTPELAAAINQHAEQVGFYVSAGSATIHAGQMPVGKSVESRFVLTQTNDSQRLAIVRQKSGIIEIRKWDNWYEYPESFWLIGRKGGVDRGEARPGIYAFHCLVGHHGIFSLTPLWILSLGGLPLMSRHPYRRFGWIGLMTLVVSVVVVAFYLSRPLEDRNYGGGTSALRWLLWMAPLWLVAAVPMVDLLAKSIWGKIFVAILTVASIASAHYSAMNPWVHPWLYELLVQMEWIQPF